MLARMDVSEVGSRAWAPGRTPSTHEVALRPLRVLHVSARDGSHSLDLLADPALVGPVDLALRAPRAGAGITVIGGTGGLGGTSPSLGWLVAAGVSPAWGAPFVELLGSAGAAWAGLGVDALVLEGSAPNPTALRVTGAGPRLRVESLALPSDAWSSPPDGGEAPARVGSDALRARLVQAGWGVGDGCSPVALLTGPAALRSKHGSLLLTRLSADAEEDTDVPAPHVARGGFGSRLVQTHGLLAVVFGGGGDSPGAPPPAAEWIAPAFPPNNLMLLREWLAFFNHRSVFFPLALREEVYELLVARTLLPQLEASGRSTTLRSDCGPGCTRPCQERTRQYRRSDEALLALGPLLGVFDLEAIDALTRFSRAVGADVLEAAGTVAWLMECLDSGWIEPAPLRVAQRPSWDVEDFDPFADSHHNAALAGTLLERLYLGPHPEGAAFTDLRAVASRLGGRAADAAVLLSRGPTGWACPAPILAPDALVPLALPLRGMLHDRYDYLAPRELGRRAGRWLTLELALANLGVCPEQRDWALQGGLDELMRARQASGSWRRHHSALASLIGAQSRAHPWEGTRVHRLLGRYLLQAQLNLPPDPVLDRWVARSHRSPARTYAAYLGEMEAGVSEALGG